MRNTRAWLFVSRVSGLADISNGERHLQSTLGRQGHHSLGISDKDRHDMNSTIRTTRWRPLDIGGSKLISDRVLVGARACYPALICGVRMAASVCLALYVAFWLQLDNAYWAGASAAAVCQPTLGASLRKGWYRMIGTVIGASVIVGITGCFVQSRVAFLVSIALWGGLCAAISTLLRNFASYGAALASTTAIIIGCDTLGVTGGPDGQTFILAITRASEICIGIVCAGFVLAATDFGGARRRLAVQFEALLAEVWAGLLSALSGTGARQGNLQSVRRALVGRVVALDPVIDQTLGESSEIRYHSPVITRATEGLFDALVGWQAIANHLMRLPSDVSIRQADAVRQLVAPHLVDNRQSAVLTPARSSACHSYRLSRRAVRLLVGTPTSVPSLRLLLDQTTMALAGISRALAGVALLNASSNAPLGRRSATRPFIADWLPSIINGVRAFITIGAAEILWIVTAWPTGSTCIIWAAIAVVLFGPKSDRAYTTALGFCVGAIIAAVFASIVKFAVLPRCESFWCLCAVFACYLIPIGALGSRGRLPGLFGVTHVGFVALVTPANIMVYDTAAFYNAALALIAGTLLAALAFLLLPPLSAAVRTRRLLASSLRDVRKIAAGRGRWSAREWKRRVYARLLALPDFAQPVERAQLTASVTAGTALIRLRRLIPSRPIVAPLERALNAVSTGHCNLAIEALAMIERHLSTANHSDEPKHTIRARASLLALSELLKQHSAYFCGEAAR